MKNKIIAKEVIAKVKKSAEREKPSCGYKYIAEYEITDKDGDMNGTSYRARAIEEIDEILKALFWGDNPMLED